MRWVREASRDDISDFEDGLIQKAIDTIAHELPHERGYPGIMFRIGKTEKRAPDTPKMKAEIKHL